MIKKDDSPEIEQEDIKTDYEYDDYPVYLNDILTSNCSIDFSTEEDYYCNVSLNLAL
jgi:hypothetical protein